MANLTAPKVFEFYGPQREVQARVGASTTYYKGAILVYGAGGLAVKPTDGPSLEVAGIVSGTYEGGVRDDAYAVGATPIRAKLRRGKAWVPFSGAVQADVGVIFYVADDQTVTKTAGTKTVGYRALDFKPGVLLFDFDTPDRIA